LRGSTTHRVRNSSCIRFVFDYLVIIAGLEEHVKRV
jgi:hypothetical protein